MANEITQKTQSLAVTSKQLEMKLVQTIQAYAKEGKVALPQNYSAENAIKQAFLQLSQMTRNNQPVLQACSQASVSQAILDMTLQGLSPVRQQCYFIPTGNRLTLFRSYFGTVKATLMACPSIKKVDVLLLHEGDKYSIGFDQGEKALMLDPASYITSLENQDKPIVGAWAYAVNKDGSIARSVLMTRKEIEASWDQSTNRNWRSNPNDVHVKFAGEMAKKSALGRLCKMLINTSDDASLSAEAYQRTSENEWRDITPKKQQAARGTEGLKQVLKEKEAEPVSETAPESGEASEPEFSEEEEDIDAWEEGRE